MLTCRYREVQSYSVKIKDIASYISPRICVPSSIIQTLLEHPLPPFLGAPGTVLGDFIFSYSFSHYS